MKPRTLKYRYVERLSAEEMHEDSKEWFSELSFVKDEQQFLNHIIQYFAVKPLYNKELERINDFTDSLGESQYYLNSLYKQVQKHMNQLEIMIDDVGQMYMERAYRSTHLKLLLKVNRYLQDYRAVKERGFVKLSMILKEEKTKKESDKLDDNGLASES
jgi:hypothetical protein